MNEQERRKELMAQYRHTHSEAGVYRIVNSRNNKSLLGSTPNLPGVRNKLEFARKTNSPGALDHRLRKDVQQYGLDSFSLEVLDVLEIKPEMTYQEILDHLEVMERLWREKLDPSLLY